MKEISLFHAKWCGHCINFLPIWKKLKENFKNIKFSDYEESENQNIFNEKGIESFPTIIMKINNNETEYNGNRDYNTLSNILNEINDIESNNGGSKIKKYYINYK